MSYPHIFSQSLDLKIFGGFYAAVNFVVENQGKRGQNEFLSY